MNILILGNHLDVHAVHIKNILTERGVKAEYLDTSLFPRQLRLSWEPHSQSGKLTLASGDSLDLQEIKSVFWRSFSEVNPPKLADAHQQMIAFHDSMSLLKTFFKSCNAHWVNSIEAYEFHQQKPLQLRRVSQLGVKIPQTVITNDPEQVMNLATSGQKMIFKPVYGGAHAQILTDEYLDPKRLVLALKVAPITVQQYILGTNIRSFVLDDVVYSAEIRSSSVDFREDEQAQLIPIDTPEIIQQQAIAITQALSMRWTAIDWRLSPSGDYFYLEANPSPMFLYFEHQTGFPISEKLVQLLMKSN